MAEYAKGTSVPKEQTAGQIVAMLRKQGATQTMMFDGDTGMGVAWSAEGATYRVSIPKPLPKKDRYGKIEPPAATAKEEDRRWRSMFLYVKAKLVAIEEGLVEYKQAFLSEIVNASGVTLWEASKQQLESGRIPSALALPMPGGGDGA